METSDFIQRLEEEFEDVPKGTITPQTSFRDMPEWSSMHALIIIALIDTEYGVTLNGEDLRSAVTVQDIYDIIKSRSKR
jgi:acyl carrier protein